MTDRRELGQQLRVDSVRCSAAAGSGHPTSSMSAADLMAVLIDGHLKLDYSKPDNPANDHLIFSKGHASPLYYAVLKAVGAIDDAELLTFRKLDSRLEGHPTPRIPPTDVATGSLGQGLPIGVGVAMAGRSLDKLPYRVWVLCGDSEMAEGSMWEAFQHAGWEGLDNLTAIIDVNRLGQTRETMLGWDLDGYVRRLEAFGWKAIAIDGHDVDAIEAAYAEAEATTGQPTAIVARTKKGKGVKAVEDQDGKHGKPLEDAEEAIEELGGERSLTVSVAKPEAGEPHRFETSGGELPSWDLDEEVATRKAYGAVDHGARLASAATSSRSTARSRTPRTPRTSARSTRTATSRCSSPSSNSSPPRSACRCAAGRRSRPRSPRSSRARTTSSAWARSRAPRSRCPARTPASRSARTARRRWRSRTSRRSARSTARRCCTRATRTRRRSSWQRWPTARGSRSSARCAARRPCARRVTRTCASAARRIAHEGDDVAIVACGITVDEAVKAAKFLAEDGVRARVLDAYSIKPIDAEAVRAAARECGAIVTVEDHWPEGGLGDAVLEALAEGDERAHVVKLAVREMPTSGTPEELLHAAKIDAEAIVDAARRLVAAPA